METEHEKENRLIPIESANELKFYAIVRGKRREFRIPKSDLATLYGVWLGASHTEWVALVAACIGVCWAGPSINAEFKQLVQKGLVGSVSDYGKRCFNQLVNSNEFYPLDVLQIGGELFDQIGRSLPAFADYEERIDPLEPTKD